MTRVPENPCSIVRGLSVLGGKWTFLILRDAFDGLTRFEDFRESLGIAADILSARLATLVEHGVMDKVEYQEPGRRRRSAYELTEAGRALMPILAALQAWGDEYLPWPVGPTVARCEKDSGRAVHVGFIDENGSEVSSERVLLSPTHSYPPERLELLGRLTARS